MSRHRFLTAVVCAAFVVLAWYRPVPVAAQSAPNTCPSDHPVQYTVPLNAKDKANVAHNYQIPGGDYHIESITPNAIQLCGEPWPAYDKNPPDPVACNKEEGKFFLRSNGKTAVPYSDLRVSSFALSADGQVLSVVLCSKQLVDHVKQAEKLASAEQQRDQALAISNDRLNTIRWTSWFTVGSVMLNIILIGTIIFLIVRRNKPD